MSRSHLAGLAGLICLFIIGGPFLSGQDPKKEFDPKKDFDFKKFGPPKGMGEVRPIVSKFDKDGDGKLNAQERAAAREFLQKEAKEKGNPFFGPPKGFPGKGKEEPTKPGPIVSPNQVKVYPDAGLYDLGVLRTVFLEFDNADWESELADFYHTDVEIPAKVMVDGKLYTGVGVHFRGNSSFFTVKAGQKRSLNLSFDFTNDKQRLMGYKTVNLLNSHDDPTFMSTVLFANLARKYIPAPKANFVKVIINGESWGLYTNVQQFNKEFLSENYQTNKGARWRVVGGPGGKSGLGFVGDNLEDYKRAYKIKSNDNEKDWKALVQLCKTLNQTPPDRLEEALKPILAIDEVLWFLALDNVLINNDGYWARASDFNLYRDPKGVFHVIPHDMNETFQTPHGPMMGGKGPFPFGPPDGKDRKDGKDPKEAKDGKDEKKPFPFPFPGMGGKKGVDLDPLVGLDDAGKPLRSKLLAVPSLRKKYLDNVRTLAEEGLDWKKLGPIVQQYRKLIEPELEMDTRKLTSMAQFRFLMGDPMEAPEAGFKGPGMPLRDFAHKRREYLLKKLDETR